MRDIISVFRLLSVVERKGKDQKEEAEILTKALKRGNADLTFHIKCNEGDISEVTIGDWSYSAFNKNGEILKKTSKRK